MREAVLRELKRGGQAYYLYNEVETIENRRARARRSCCPRRASRSRTGRCRERELERVMRDFYHQRSNVLLCSTIIETGIDVPTANTILIHRADKFGLAQLHQLRGRVGRSHHQAYAYLMPPDEGALRAAKKRLEAIQMMEDLGAASTSRCTTSRSAARARCWARSQSGGIHDVGFALYTEMLEHAVQSLKKGGEPDLLAPFNVATEVNLHAPALLPEIYCGDVHERLVLYKRLANCSTDEELERLTEELVDRFGPLPEPTRVLLECHKLRIQGAPLGVQKIDAAPSAIVVQFVPEPPVDPKKSWRWCSRRASIACRARSA